MSGLAVAFDREDAFLGATRRLRGAGFSQIEAFTPYPVEALDDLLAPPPLRSLLPVLVFAAGVLGLAGGFLLQAYGAGISYPLNIGGRPPVSWPSFIPIAFEIAVFCAVAAGFFGFFVLAGLPAPYQPIFALPGFERATQDRFFLLVDSADRHMVGAEIERLVQEFAPCSIVAWRP